MIKTYTPILLTLLLVLFLTVLFAGMSNLHTFLQVGLGFFFLIFSYFKLMDIPGFAAHFRQYDIIARRMPAYAFAYPFVELALGLGYLFNVHVDIVAIATIIMIVVRGIGIAKAARSAAPIMCGCMGTAALFPINWATIAANVATVAAAAYVLAY